MSDSPQAMDLLDRLLGHDAWGTRALLELALALSDEQLDRPFDIGHRTIRNTFEHVVWNIECWTDLMKGGPVRDREPPGASISRLIERHADAAEQLHCFAREIADASRLNDTYVDDLDAPPGRKSFGGTFVHLATHGMYHRAQLRYMLRQLGVTELPEDDALTWEQTLTA